LPLSQAFCQSEQAGWANGPGDALRVLIVEDYPDVALSLWELLEVWGHAPRIAATGPAALELAPAFCPHVVLCDLGLPGMDGIDLCIALRELPELAGSRIVAMSGYPEAYHGSRLAQAPFEHFLLKPGDPDLLRSLLDASALSQRRRWSLKAAA
jgi:CheY-like chemotaxis protein